MKSAHILSSLLGTIGATSALNAQDTLGFMDRTDDTTTSSLTSSIHTVIPGSSYIVKLGYDSLPYLGRVHDEKYQVAANPQPSSLLLNFTVGNHASQDLYLNKLSFHPLWYECRRPLFHGYPFPWAPPFQAYQVPADILPKELESLDTPQEWPTYELVYTHLYMTVQNHSNINSSPCFLELNITGLRHKAHSPFSTAVDHSSSHRALEPMHTVRIVYNNEQKILAIELGQTDNTTYKARTGPQSQSMFKGKSILGSDWGGFLSKPADFKTLTEFDPGEWDDCGRKDDYWRQLCCKLDDWGTWARYFGRDDGALIMFITGAVLLSLASGGLLLWLSWMAWRGVKMMQDLNKNEMDENEGERDKLLLEDDEDLEEAKLNDGVATIGQINVRDT